MTTYKCKDCGEHWSVGPTRDYKTHMACYNCNISRAYGALAMAYSQLSGSHISLNDLNVPQLREDIRNGLRALESVVQEKIPLNILYVVRNPTDEEIPHGASDDVATIRAALSVMHARMLSYKYGYLSQPKPPELLNLQKTCAEQQAKIKELEALLAKAQTASYWLP